MNDEQAQALIEENKRLRDNLAALQKTMATLAEDYSRISKSYSMTLRQSILHQLLCSTLANSGKGIIEDRCRWAIDMYDAGVKMGIYLAEFAKPGPIVLPSTPAEGSIFALSRDSPWMEARRQ